MTASNLRAKGPYMTDSYYITDQLSSKTTREREAPTENEQSLFSFSQLQNFCLILTLWL